MSPVSAYINPGAYISSWEERRGLCGSQQHSANSNCRLWHEHHLAVPGAGRQQFEDVFSSYTGLTLQEIKTSALSCRIPCESIWIQGLDFLNCAIPPEKLLDSDPKKKNVFSTMQCHISLFINHFLNLIIQKVVSEQLTTSTALARMLLRWWKACPLATPERFNILYFPNPADFVKNPLSTV